MKKMTCRAKHYPRPFAVVYCLRPRGHYGDHRGEGAQWRDDGRRVPATISLQTARAECR